MTLCSIGVVARLYGVSASTIRRWAAKGLLTVARCTLGGHRRFELDNSCVWPQACRLRSRFVLRLKGRPAASGRTTQNLRLRGSHHRYRFRSQLQQALSQNSFEPNAPSKIHTLSVVYEDRLLRFGTALIRLMCRRAGTDVRILENKPAQSFEEELAKDVVTLMTVFCAHLYGKRSHKTKQTAT